MADFGFARFGEDEENEEEEGQGVNKLMSGDL